MHQEQEKQLKEGVTGNKATKDSGQDPAPADSESVKALVKGIKEIVGVVLKKNEGGSNVTKTAEDDKKDVGKLFEKKESGTGK